MPGTGVVLPNSIKANSQKDKSKNMKTIDLKKMLALGIGMTLAGTVHGAMLIDDFNSPIGGQSVGIIDGVVGQHADLALNGLAGVLGGSRDLYVEIQHTYNSPVANQCGAAANGITSTDFLTYFNDANVDSVCKVTWDGNGSGLNTNLAAETSFLLFTTFNDSAVAYTITLSTIGGGTSTQTINEGAGFSGDVSFPMASFAGTASLADVDSITLAIEGTRGTDVSIHTFSTVPETSSTGLALLGVVGLGLARRRRN